MNYNFSDETKTMLQRTGWYEGRQVDIGEVEKKLSKKGLDVFPVARELLTEFNGLEFSFTDKTWFCIDALEGLDALQEDENDFEQIEYLNKLLNKKLCPIGIMGDSITLVSGDGEIVYLWLWVSVGIAKNFAEVLENYFTPAQNPTKSFDLHREQIPPGWRD